MIIDIFNEMSWLEFQGLESIKNLPLNEQQLKFEEYISELSLARDFYYEYQVKGNNAGPYPAGYPTACSIGMDVVFCIDFTGSMRSPIDDIKTNIASIVSAIVSASNNNYRLGLVIFDAYAGDYFSRPPNYVNTNIFTGLPASQVKAFPPTSYSAPPPSSVYQIVSSLVMMSQNNSSAFNTVLQQLNTGSPGDSGAVFPIGGGAVSNGPEPGDLALGRIINGAFAGTFRNDVARLVITISDNYPGGNDELYNADVITRLQNQIAPSNKAGIQHLAMIDLDPLTPYPIPMAPNTGYRILTDNTDGIFEPSFDPTSIINAINNLCTDNA